MTLNKLRPILRSMQVQTSYVRRREGYRVHQYRNPDRVRLTVDFDDWAEACRTAQEIVEQLRGRGLAVEYKRDTPWMLIG